LIEFFCGTESHGSRMVTQHEVYAVRSSSPAHLFDVVVRRTKLVAYPPDACRRYGPLVTPWRVDVAPVYTEFSDARQCSTANTTAETQIVDSVL